MDIHGPQAPIYSVKQFFLHLLTITIGILIALSLGGATEWYHHWALALQGRTNLAMEARDNKVELDKALAIGGGTRDALHAALQLADDLLAHKKSTRTSLSINFNVAQLTSASWSTAQATGALAYMDYQEVQNSADLYEAQQQFVRLQDRFVETIVATLAVFQSGDFDKGELGAAAVAAWKQDIVTALSYLETVEQVGQQLSERYAKHAMTK
jgi:hypothetical protein